MDNTHIILAANIQKYRKKSGLTQEELAENLGVTFQAVSKWENAKSAPDIKLLPEMAELFGCYIDELFSREVKTEVHYDHCPQFPWYDDDMLRGVVCLGRKVLQITEGITDKFTFELKGDPKSVQSECNIFVEGNVSGGCIASGDLAVNGNVSGGCNCGENMVMNGSFSGGANAGGDIKCGGNFTGDVNCINITVDGNVEAERISGNVVCGSLKCDYVKGEVSVNNEVQ